MKTIKKSMASMLKKPTAKKMSTSKPKAKMTKKFAKGGIKKYQTAGTSEAQGSLDIKEARRILSAANNMYGSRDKLVNRINTYLPKLNAQNKAFYDSLPAPEKGMTREAYSPTKGDRQLEVAKNHLKLRDEAEKYIRNYEAANPVGTLKTKSAKPIIVPKSKRGGTFKSKPVAKKSAMVMKKTKSVIKKKK